MLTEPNYCLFQVKDSEFSVIEMQQHETRGKNSIAMMKTIVSLVPEKFEGMTGYINYCDNPPDSLPKEIDLHFCTTRRVEEPSPCIPFPCPFSLRWPQVGIPDGPRLLLDFLEYRGDWKENRIFWIGANLHPSRKKLGDLSKLHPAAIDATLMEWQRGGTALQLKSKTRYVPLWDQRHYKYLIDCPGLGYSGRLRWLIASGRPVFIVERPVIEPWHALMRPWVHYIPVRTDMSDLMWAYKRLEAQPELYLAISANAREFAKSHLIHDRELGNIARAVPNLTQLRPSSLP